MPKLFPPAGVGPHGSSQWDADNARRARKEFEANRKSRKQAKREIPVVDYFQAPDGHPQFPPPPWAGKVRGSRRIP